MGESGRERSGVRKKRKKAAEEGAGGKEGGRVGNAWERESELCEGTRLKRTEQSRAEQSYFT